MFQAGAGSESEAANADGSFTHSATIQCCSELQEVLRIRYEQQQGEIGLTDHALPDPLGATPQPQAPFCVAQTALFPDCTNMGRQGSKPPKPGLALFANQPFALTREQREQALRIGGAALGSYVTMKLLGAVLLGRKVRAVPTRRGSRRRVVVHRRGASAPKSPTNSKGSSGAAVRPRSPSSMNL